MKENVIFESKALKAAETKSDSLTKKAGAAVKGKCSSCSCGKKVNNVKRYSGFGGARNVIGYVAFAAVMAFLKWQSSGDSEEENDDPKVEECREAYKLCEGTEEECEAEFRTCLQAPQDYNN